MVDLIDHYVPSCNRILDLGCGSGLYGEQLKRNCRELIGFDFDPILCDYVRGRGSYDAVIQEDIRRVAAVIEPVDVVFCSETLEHVPNADIEDVLRRIESRCLQRIVITIPNPLSPHFRQDPTHVLRYSIFSFLKMLNRSRAFSYTLHPLGFSQYNLRKPVFRILNFAARRFPSASPTVLYVGDRVA